MSSKSVQIVPQEAADAGCTATCSSYYEYNFLEEWPAGTFTSDSRHITTYYRIYASAAHHWHLDHFVNAYHNTEAHDADYIAYSSYYENPYPSESINNGDNGDFYEQDWHYAFVREGKTPTYTDVQQNIVGLSAVFEEDEKYHIFARVQDESANYGKISIDNSTPALSARSAEQFEDEFTDFTLRAIPNENCSFVRWYYVHFDENHGADTFDTETITVHNSTTTSGWYEAVFKSNVSKKLVHTEIYS